MEKILNSSRADVVKRYVSLCLLGCILIYPNIVYACASNAGISYVLTSIVYALPLVALVGICRRRWVYSVLVVLLTILSIIDLTMVDLYQSYLLPGAIISTIKTNPQEAQEFYSTNLKEVVHWLPLIGLCVVTCLMYRKIGFTRQRIAAMLIALLLPVGFVSAKLVVSYHTVLTLRYFVDNRILNRPPYNVFFQSVNTAKELHKRAAIASAKNTDFGASRITPPRARSVHTCYRRISSLQQPISKHALQAFHYSEVGTKRTPIAL